ncbi:Hypothetical predicted protein [Cloeon dipterum]|uniref:USP domain-containing protein n=1 Tax=Cloeon dipterum TaxID=197152 RepID=A0A8S1DQT9_9INSE|nr:Hypothetical predicted protein [Cloeon dipterum]
MGKKVAQPAQQFVRFNMNIFADVRLICETTRPKERNLRVVRDKDDKLSESSASKGEARQRRAGPDDEAETQPVCRKQGVGRSSPAAFSTQRDSGDGKRHGKKTARTSLEGRGTVLCDITKKFEIAGKDTPCQDQPSPKKSLPAREPLMAEVLQNSDGKEENTETPSLTESNVNDDKTFQTQPVAAKRTLLADQSSSQNHLGEPLAKVLQCNDGEGRKTETPNLSKCNVNDDKTFQTPPAVSKQTRLAGQSSSQNHLGLKNPGLMCYMNASLQALAAAEPFRSYLIEAEITHKESEEVYNIASVIENIPAAKPVKEKRVNQELEYLCNMNQKQFNLHNDVQQDAHEYITQLITLLDEKLREFRNKNLSEDLLCSTCLMLPCFCEGKCKRNTTPNAIELEQVILMLDIPEVENDDNDKSMTVQYLIDESLKTKFENRCCGLPVTAFSIFTKLPRVLIVSLRRYTATEKKIDRYIEASSDLVLSEYRCDEGKIKEFKSNKDSRDKSNRLGHVNKKYKLVGIVNHIGSSVKCGHYKAGVFNAGEGAWYEVNDEKVTWTEMSSIICNSAKTCYLLVYVVVEGVEERVRSLTINSG